MLCDRCRKHFKQQDLMNYNNQYLCIKCIGDAILEEKNKNIKKGFISKILNKFKKG